MQILQKIFAFAQIAITLAFLTYASYSDYKTREVTNRVWTIYAPIAALLTISQLVLFASSQLWLFGLSFGLTTGFALLLFYTGGFGGADSKALMCIALALPFFPAVIVTPLLPEGISPLSQLLFPITVLSNAVLVAAASALYLLSRNIARKITTGKPLFDGSLAQESIGKKILVLVTGQKFPLATLKAKWHVYPLEDISVPKSEGDNPQRKLMVMPTDEGRDDVVARLSQAAEAGQIDSKVWATPGLPMLIFITVGLLLALSLGDIIWFLVAHLFG